MFHVNMEALYFLNLWRPTTTTTRKDNQLSTRYSDPAEISSYMVDMDDEFDQEEDSFFELELTVPDFDNNNNSDTNKSGRIEHPLDTDSNRFDFKEATLHNTTIRAGSRESKYQQPTLSLSPSDFPSKRSKILPFEQSISSKPQSSPISLLKSSAPRFRVRMFKKSKSMAAQETVKKAGEKGGLVSGVFTDAKAGTQKQRKQDGSSKLFAVKFFKLEEAASNVPIFTKQTSLRKHISTADDDPLSSSDHESSKRFSNKEVIQKYLKLIKPLYIKVSRKQSENVKFSGELSVSSPSSSPATFPLNSPKDKKQGNSLSGFRVVCKHLGKSKSTGVAPSTAASRRDDTLLLQHDGIQSAILHCKKSFNSSSDSSLFSRFSTDPLPERSMSAPRFSSEENGIN